LFVELADRRLVLPHPEMVTPDLIQIVEMLRKLEHGRQADRSRETVTGQLYLMLEGIRHSHVAE
jgi:hypothetical protein